MKRVLKEGISSEASKSDADKVKKIVEGSCPILISMEMQQYVNFQENLTTGRPRVFV